MRPEEKGRFCAVCTKVVHDFTDTPLTDVMKTLAQAPAGSVCGRVRAPRVSAPPTLPAQVWLRFPVGRLRRFLIALVACFGPSIWGLDPLVAQQLPRQVSTQPVLARQVKGQIVDVITREGIEGVNIQARRDAAVSAIATTDSSGHFSLRLPADFVQDAPYELVATYLGSEKITYAMPQDVTEVLVTIDAAVLTETVWISHELRDGYGVVGMLEIRPEPKNPEITASTVTAYLGSISYLEHEPLERYYYNPLDTWIWMRNSEVNHTGRH